jgi:hypothetical protein
MTVERENILEKLFALETWERLDWLNQKWNKSKEEKADIIKSAGAFPLIVMSLIMADWIFGALIFNISNNQFVRVITGIWCAWLFIAINLTRHLPYVLRTIVISMSLVFIMIIPALLALVI